MAHARRLGAGILLGILGLAMIAPASRSDDSEALMARFDRMVKYNLDNKYVVASAKIDSLANAYQALPLGDRIAAWARWFAARGGTGYLYGRDPGGYVTDGRIAQDFATDCVLFMYRVTELGRSSSAAEAIQFAFGTRFYGGTLADVIDDQGRVNYDDPVHLEYSEDMIRSQIWGEDVTDSLGTSQLDRIGSSRVPPDTLRYLPAAAIDESKIHNGDILWFIGDETEPGAAEKRRESTLIHHIGIAVRTGDTVELVHPAKRPLPGIYDAPGIVKVPLRTYLQRVGRFKGVVVTRLKEF